jgi:hypothetical protein
LALKDVSAGPKKRRDEISKRPARIDFAKRDARLSVRDIAAESELRIEDQIPLNTPLPRQ